MWRVCLLLLCSATLLQADDAPKAASEPAAAKKKKPKQYTLRQEIRSGDRFIGSNTIKFDLKTTYKLGNKERKTYEQVERTERFRDVVKQASARGPMEIQRTYQKKYTKVRDDDRGRAQIDRSPLQGHELTIKENLRSRRVRSKLPFTIPPLVRKSIGVEMDWRDILPREPIQVGDRWQADAESIAARLAPYFDSGNRSKMIVTFEAIEKVEGVERAKFYVDWKFEGMRDRELFAKVRLAGDLYFDLEMKRFTLIDLAGTIKLEGVRMGKAHHEIVIGTGEASYKSSVQRAAVAAAAEAESK
ncbi:MAG: hypothetical protein AAGD14_08520 [Planctomycetota bacterium]